jgi:superfamily II DNA or RNA helicase
MTEEEFDEYCILTRQLGKHLILNNGQMDEVSKRIAIKRARVLNNSVTKLGWVRDNFKKYQNISFTLFYTGDKIFKPLLKILGVEKSIRIHEFTQVQNNEERKLLLEQFARGEYQALVAIKCLDEGVDIPPTREAYFLASSGNPREFIQRRGRVLRLYQGKRNAIIYDLISIPPMEFIEMGISHPNYQAIRSAVKREYLRVKEFASLALNHYQALDQLYPIITNLNLLDA